MQLHVSQVKVTWWLRNVPIYLLREKARILLIQIGTEQPRNKRIFIYFPHSMFIWLLLGSIFITNLAS